MNPGSPRGTNPAHIRWQGEDTPASACDIATAVPTPEGIALAFGRREAAGLPGAVRGQLLHQVLLQPAAAEGLRQMLARLLAPDDRNPVPTTNPTKR
jgi:hypothetical protein